MDEVHLFNHGFNRKSAQTPSVQPAIPRWASNTLRNATLN
jgi:hypothetical protein